MKRLAASVERAILSAVDRHTGPLAKAVAKALNRASRDIGATVAQGRWPAAALMRLNADLAKALTPRLIALHELGSQTVKMSAGAIQTKDAERFQTVREIWARDHAASKVKGVTDSVRTSIRRSVERAVRNHTPPAQLGRELREQLGGKVAAARAARIARTELHQAAHIGQMDEASRQAQLHGKRFVKVWRSTNDHRTRLAHRMANGQARAITDPFEVGGEMLMHPGDPAASAKNVINCRCTMTLVPEQAAQAQGLAVVRVAGDLVRARLGQAEAQARMTGRVMAIQRGGELSESAAPKIYSALAREAATKRVPLMAPATLTARERAAFARAGRRKGSRLVDDDVSPVMFILPSPDVARGLTFRELLNLMETVNAPVS